MARRTVASLSAELATLRAALDEQSRATGALAEWFWSVERGHAFSTLDVYSDGSPRLPDGTQIPIRLEIRGMGRACGGVVVVRSDDYADLPQYLDDLCAAWLGDSAAEIRDAARLMLRRRNEFIRSAAAGQGSPPVPEQIEGTQ